jgi:hypothetical protein
LGDVDDELDELPSLLVPLVPLLLPELELPELVAVPLEPVELEEEGEDPSPPVPGANPVGDCVPVPDDPLVCELPGLWGVHDEVCVVVVGVVLVVLELAVEDPMQPPPGLVPPSVDEVDPAADCPPVLVALSAPAPPVAEAEAEAEDLWLLGALSECVVGWTAAAGAETDELAERAIALLGAA